MPARAGAPTGGVARPPAAGSASAERQTAPPRGARARRLDRYLGGGRRARPIRREDVYTERMQAAGNASVDGGARDELVVRCRSLPDTGRTCNACVQRRHRAWKLVDRDGRTIDEAAAVMRLPPPQCAAGRA